MAPSKLKKAINAVKDQTSIGLARVNTSTSISDIEVTVVKATRHEEYPADERHFREILSLTSYSRANISACINTISRRLNKTKNWVVALKTLMLIQRLLADGDPSYEQEIFFATRRGTRFLNMSDFRDASRSNSGWDYSAFVRTYALYMDELLEFRMQGKRGKRSAFASYEDEEKEDNDEEREEERGGGFGMRRERKASVRAATPVQDLKSDRMFSRVQHLMQLMERFLACRPTGSAKQNRLVLVALYPIVKESFLIYFDLVEVQHIFLDRFVGLEIAECAKAYDIFCRMAKQFDELDGFYIWCKSSGIARSSEYPVVNQVSQKSLDLMDEYIRERSTSVGRRKPPTIEQKKENEEEEKKSDVLEEDMNATKALPPPEGWEEEKKEEEVVEKPPKEEPKPVEKEPDLLNLGDDVATTAEQHGDSLALALFDGGAGSNGGGNTTQPWEAFKDTENWETALVLSTTHLPNQKASLPGGFDTMLLDSMYQQGATMQAVNSSGYAATGSASSVAFGSAGRPAMLALPPPPTATGAANVQMNFDPFSASVPVPPPSYVQMSEMERKQRLLVQEQMMWQQYRGNQMQGQVGFNQMQPNPYPYNMGGYTHT